MNNPPYIFGPEAIEGLIKSAAKNYRVELVRGLRQLVRERKIFYKVVHANPPESAARLAAYDAFKKNETEICKNLQIESLGCYYCGDNKEGKSKWFLFFNTDKFRGMVSFLDLYAKGRNPKIKTRDAYALSSPVRAIKISELATEIIREEMKKHLIRVERPIRCGDCSNFNKTVIPGTKYHQCSAAVGPEEFRRLYLDEPISVTIEDSPAAKTCEKFKQK